jgi:16S rRNA (cytidine1402-2'-O)-methyltransferase
MSGNSQVFGDIEIVIAREMTKMYEEFLRGTVSYMIDHFTKSQPKGELVIMFHQ